MKKKIAWDIWFVTNASDHTCILKISFPPYYFVTFWMHIRDWFFLGCAWVIVAVVLYEYSVEWSCVSDVPCIMSTPLLTVMVTPFNTLWCMTPKHLTNPPALTILTIIIFFVPNITSHPLHQSYIVSLYTNFFINQRPCRLFPENNTPFLKVLWRCLLWYKYENNERRLRFHFILHHIVSCSSEIRSCNIDINKLEIATMYRPHVISGSHISEIITISSLLLIFFLVRYLGIKNEDWIYPFNPHFWVFCIKMTPRGNDLNWKSELNFLGHQSITVMCTSFMLLVMW